MDFFAKYFEYVGNTECPMSYHRWTAISILAAILGRNIWLPFGHGRIYPNMYIMIMGSPGARKGTAMNIGAKLLKKAGYKRFCPDRLSKERFLMEIKPYDYEVNLDFSDEEEIESLNMEEVSEIYAFAEEFGDLVGQGGMEFMTMLTKLWDNMSKYEHPKIHGKSIVVEQPTVNILGGNTTQGLALSIPPESIGNGFLSRMIFVHSEPTNIQITFPEKPSSSLEAELISYLQSIRDELKGEVSFSAGSKILLDRIYKNAVEVDDIRFKHYMSRRFTHLLKVCLIISASKKEMEVSSKTVLEANTVLADAERRMPRSLGEFGKGKYNEVSGVILEILSKATKPMSINEIFKKVGRDLSKMTELSDIMKSLWHAEKVTIKTINGKQGYMSNFAVSKIWPQDLITEDYLTNQERD